MNTHSQHPVNTPTKHTLSKPRSHTFSTRFIDKPSQHTLLTLLIHKPYQRGSIPTYRTHAGAQHDGAQALSRSHEHRTGGREKHRCGHRLQQMLRPAGTSSPSQRPSLPTPSPHNTTSTRLIKPPSQHPIHTPYQHILFIHPINTPLTHPITLPYPLRQVLTGFDLGRVLTTLGSPAQLGACSNESALKYLAEMWRHQRLAEEQQMALDMAAAAAAARNLQQQRQGDVYGGDGGVLMGGIDCVDNSAHAHAHATGVYLYPSTNYSNNNYNNNSIHNPASNQYQHHNSHHHNNSQNQVAIAPAANASIASTFSLSHPAHTSDIQHHHQHHQHHHGSSGDMVGGALGGLEATAAAAAAAYQHHPPHHHVYLATAAAVDAAGTGAGAMAPSSSSLPLQQQPSSIHTPRGTNTTTGGANSRSPHSGSPGSKRVTIMGVGMGGNSNSFGSSGDSSQGGHSSGSNGHSGGSSRMSGSGCHQREGLSLNGSADSALSNGDMDTCYLSQGAVSLSREDLDDLFEGFSQEAMLKRFSFASACADSFTLNDHPGNATASDATTANTMINGGGSMGLATASTQGCADEAEELFALLDSAMRSHPSIANVINDCCNTNTSGNTSTTQGQEGVVDHMNQLQQHHQMQQQTASSSATPDSSVQDFSLHSFNPQNPLNHPHLNFVPSDGCSIHNGSTNGAGHNNNHSSNNAHKLLQPGVHGNYSNSDADLSRVIDSLGLASPLKNNSNHLAFPEGMLSIGTMGGPGAAGLVDQNQNGNTFSLPNMLLPLGDAPAQIQQEGGNFVNDGLASTSSSFSSSSSTGMTTNDHASFSLSQQQQQQQGQGLAPGQGQGQALSGRDGHHLTPNLTSMTPSSSSSSSSSSGGSGSGSRSRANHHTSSRSTPRHQIKHQHHPVHSSSLGHQSPHHSSSMQSSDATAGITGVAAAAFLWQPELVSAHHPGLNATSRPRRPSFMQSAAALCAGTFNPVDLWELHQYYFSPPEPYLTYKSSSDEHLSVYIRSTASNGSLTRDRDSHHSPSGSANQMGVGVTVLSRIRSRGSNDFLLTSPTNGGGDDNGSSSHRPRKRHGNRNTMARIATYPRIKHQLEEFKTAHNDQGTTPTQTRSHHTLS